MKQSMMTKNVLGQISDQKGKGINLVSMTLSENDGSKARVDYVEVKVDDITPRSINKYKQNRIERLAKSIRNTNNRLIHPIVLVRGEDLNPASEVYQKFVEQGQKPEELKYIIVSGERRFRAWLFLREEEKGKNAGKIIFTNPFDTITANILSKAEAKNEHSFFEDSNLETRQLTSLEAVLHIKAAIDEVQTEEQKKAAMVEMGKDPKKKFNQAEYCKYYLESELGIESVSISTIKNDLNILDSCRPEVVDAVLAEKIKPRNARDLCGMNEIEQLRLLNIYLNEGAAKFNDEVEELKKKKKAPKNTRKTHRDAARSVLEGIKREKQKVEELTKICNELGNEDRKQVNLAIEAIRKAINVMEGCYNHLKQ